MLTRVLRPVVSAMVPPPWTELTCSHRCNRPSGRGMICGNVIIPRSYEERVSKKAAREDFDHRNHHRIPPRIRPLGKKSRRTLRGGDGRRGVPGWRGNDPSAGKNRGLGPDGVRTSRLPRYIWGVLGFDGPRAFAGPVHGTHSIRKERRSCTDPTLPPTAYGFSQGSGIAPDSTTADGGEFRLAAEGALDPIILHRGGADASPTCTRDPGPGSVREFPPVRARCRDPVPTGTSRLTSPPGDGHWDEHK
jgi:hypothetical protein